MEEFLISQICFACSIFLGGYLKIRVILPIYSMSFFLLRSTTYFFYGDLFLSLPQPPPLVRGWH